jgi:Fic family protein
MAAKHLKPWIWQRPGWPEFHWDSARLAQPLAAARRAQGELSGMARLLDPNSDLYAQLEVLTSEGVATSAIEGERFDPNALRSSLARRLDDSLIFCSRYSSRPRCGRRQPALTSFPSI